MPNKKGGSEGEAFVEYLCRVGVEVERKPSELMPGDVIVDFHQGVLYWEVFRVLSALSGRSLILDVAIDSFASDRRRRVRFCEGSDRVVVLVASCPVFQAQGGA